MYNRIAAHHYGVSLIGTIATLVVFIIAVRLVLQREVRQDIASAGRRLGGRPG